MPDKYGGNSAQRDVVKSIYIIWRKKMKKIITFILIAILLFVAVACNANPADDAPTVPTTEFIEEQIVVGEGSQWELNGLLTLPVGIERQIPAVVLVHGSGPQDMD